MDHCIEAYLMMVVYCTKIMKITFPSYSTPTEFQSSKAARPLFGQYF